MTVIEHQRNLDATHYQASWDLSLRNFTKSSCLLYVLGGMLISSGVEEVANHTEASILRHAAF